MRLSWVGLVTSAKNVNLLGHYRPRVKLVLRGLKPRDCFKLNANVLFSELRHICRGGTV